MFSIDSGVLTFHWRSKGCFPAACKALKERLIPALSHVMTCESNTTMLFILQEVSNKKQTNLLWKTEQLTEEECQLSEENFGEKWNCFFRTCRSERCSILSPQRMTAELTSFINDPFTSGSCQNLIFCWVHWRQSWWIHKALTLYILT